MADMWMHSSEYQWLHDYVVGLRTRAVRDMEAGVNMEDYAVLRGYIQACDAVLNAPDFYIRQIAARETARLQESM